jgi:hypothetical protein
MGRRSGIWVIDVPLYRAKDPPHRATGRTRGHPQHDDAGLAEAVRRIQAVLDVSEKQAVGVVASSLDVLGIEPISARKRVRRAL